MKIETEPSSRVARIVVTAAILALAAILLAHPTKEASETTPPLSEAKIEPMGPIQPAGEREQSQETLPKAKASPEVATNPPTRDFANQAEAKAFLATLLPHERDIKIISEIIQCESGWEHFRPNGDVKVASGNVGFGQLNSPTWKKWMLKNHQLDIYREKENLKATVIIYLRSGVNPWRPYSGHCWLPKLQAMGIEI